MEKEAVLICGQKGEGGNVSYHLVCDVCDVCVGDKRGEAGERANSRMDNEGKRELRKEEDRKGERENRGSMGIGHTCIRRT